ncbi:MAG: hypothetical protein FWC54_00110, partial [Actinomycetia bacterium]|nr:hypothetical protein [Actinomycetes bacterium]
MRIRKHLSGLIALALVMSLFAGAPLSAHAQDAVSAEPSATPSPAVSAEATSAPSGGAPSVKPAATPVCSINGTPYDTLDAALATIVDATHTTIKLLADISDTDGLEIIDKNITFDLNGFDLAISNTGVGLYVDGGAVDYTGTGTFTASATDNHALFVDQNNASCTLTGVTADSAFGYAAVLAYPGATVIVNGDVTASGNTYAVDAYGGTVTVNGNVTAENGSAVEAYGGASVTVNGNVTSDTSDAIDAYDGASVTVVGDVSGATGIYAGLGESDTPPTVTVTGNVTGTSHDAIDALDGAQVTVTGDVTGAYCGIYADGSESGIAPTVKVTGDVSGANGANAITAWNAIVTVTGNLIATGEITYGIYTGTGSQVTVTGDISAEDGNGVFAQDADTTVVVTGNITSGGGYVGVEVRTGAAVTVNGNITVTGGALGAGAWDADTLVTINGNITSEDTGAAAGDGGQVIVNGTITAPTYIVLMLGENYTELTADDFTEPTTMANYKTYTDSTSTVWVRSAYTITASAGAGGTITPSGKVGVDIGGSQT